ncbi:serine/threonine protein phosphatase [Priestia megaterium]|uniref:DEAD/DEAH box helicase n=1 Tax=Priestia megaterium TaxID=1404 RepID=UPI000BFD6456|nr:DEAD/DEAH box helicase [Priestia megaterium]PGZ77309.1 serine/threonine protein phosphatase [Priestia megaterium]
MQSSWLIVEKNSLVLRNNDNDIIIPTAEEIFLAEFKNKTKIRDMAVRKPSDEIESLTFSKYPIELKILLKPITHNENIYIEANMIVDYKGQQKNVIGLLDSNIDHIIIEKVWYPFVKGVIQDIKQILNKSGIEKLGKITLKQYLTLKKMESPFIIDNVQEMPIDKGPYIPNTDMEIPFFRGKLYPYQNQGYRWLKMVVNENAGCILADEMGLGKTPQIIAVLASESLNNKNPSLIVAPVSLLENWRREIQKFAPSLTVLVHQGNERTGFYSEFKKYNLVITSYETILRDLSLVKMLRWNIVVADEAQAIKNPLAKRTLAIKQIDRLSTIAVTGTPVENRLVDLWSLSDFVFPSYLGDIKQFKEQFQDEIDSAERLEPLISPILLRRRVKEVAGDLPERIDIPQVLKFSLEEAELYDSLRLQVIEDYGKSASLVSLIKLRMFCTHPFLQLPSQTGDPTIFGKYMRLVEILEEIISNKEKVIIFTSFTKMSDLLLRDLTSRFDIYCDFIDGRVDVSDRQLRIDKFSNSDDSAILILNPRAAGAGLNITAANHVIHYNLEWNPAIEDQASARAHRRGQKRPVTIYRLFCANTVEEAINERLERKRELSEAAIIGTDGSKSDNTDILEALLKSPLR